MPGSPEHINAMKELNKKWYIILRCLVHAKHRTNFLKLRNKIAIYAVTPLSYTEEKQLLHLV